MANLVNLSGTALSPVYLAQLALKYNVPAVSGAPKPSDVPALKPYVPPQTYIQPPAPPPVQPFNPPVREIVPTPPPALPNKPDVVSGGETPQPEPDTGHACTRCGSGGTSNAGVSASLPTKKEATLSLVAKAPTPAAATLLPTTDNKLPSWLGTLLTVGGAVMTMRGP